LDVSPLTRLTRQQRALVWATAAAVAVSRIYALSHTLWDWDEALFASAMRDFDVPSHHPHPPGFPLFVAFAHVARLFTSSDFRAYQAVVFIAAIALFPLMFALGRALRMSFAESYTAALVLAFMPNVWYYGGTGFSDIPALAVMLASAAALFASRSGDRRLYLIGALLLGAAMAFRPQNALIGVYPFLAASWPRIRERKLDVALAATCVIAVVVASYGGAALASSSPANYIGAVRSHQQYVSQIDSYRNPGRPPLYEVFKIYIVHPFEAKRLSLVLWALAAIGFLRIRRPAIEATLTFGPFLLFAWVMLDILGASRLSTGFMPLLALLIAQGIYFLARVLSFRKARVETAVLAILTLALVTKLIMWTAPALREVRGTVSPTVAATTWVKQHLDPARITLYVHGSMGPYTEYFLKNYRQVFVEDNFSVEDIGDTRNAWLISEGATAFEEGLNFRRPHERLWDLVRRRYFEVSVRPLSSAVTFGDGWYGEESSDTAVWRWMGRRSVTRLAPLAGRGTLRTKFYVPLDGLTKPPVVTVSFNGEVIERFTATTADIDKRWTVNSRQGQPNELVIETDGVVKPGGDPRELGLQLQALTWRVAR